MDLSRMWIWNVKRQVLLWVRSCSSYKSSLFKLWIWSRRWKNLQILPRVWNTIWITDIGVNMDGSIWLIANALLMCSAALNLQVLRLAQNDNVASLSSWTKWRTRTLLLHVACCKRVKKNRRYWLLISFFGSIGALHSYRCSGAISISSFQTTVP